MKIETENIDLNTGAGLNRKMKGDELRKEDVNPINYIWRQTTEKQLLKVLPHKRYKSTLKYSTCALKNFEVQTLGKLFRVGVPRIYFFITRQIVVDV